MREKTHKPSLKESTLINYWTPGFLKEVEMKWKWDCFHSPPSISGTQKVCTPFNLGVPNISKVRHNNGIIAIKTAVGTLHVQSDPDFSKAFFRQCFSLLSSISKLHIQVSKFLPKTHFNYIKRISLHEYSGAASHDMSGSFSTTVSTGIDLNLHSVSWLCQLLKVLYR